MTRPTATMIPTANLERLADFYAYVLDTPCEPPRNDTSRAAVFRRGKAADLIFVESCRRAHRPAVIVDVPDDVTLQGIRRRLLCLAATDGIVREAEDGTSRLTFRDPDGVAQARRAAATPGYGGWRRRPA